MKEFKNYLFVYLLFIPATVFIGNRQLLFSIVFFVALVEFHRLGRKYGSTFVLFMGLVLILLFLQSIFFVRFSFNSTARLFMTLLLSYYVLKIVGLRILYYFINIVYGISIISFVFYFPSLLFNSVHNFIGKIAPALGTDSYLYDQNFFIYTWEYKFNGILRNSGNFTEPGYFAAILLLCLSFSLALNEKVINKKNIIFSIAILTTLSTAGYVGLFFVLTAKYLFINKRKTKYFIIPAVIFLSLIAYQRLDFLQRKVDRQIETQLVQDKSVGRFGSAKTDLIDLAKNPLTGRGLTKATRFDEVEDWEGDNAPSPILNGISDTALKLGVPGFIIFLVLLYRSIKHFLSINNLAPNGVYIILGGILIGTFSQPILFTPLYLFLLFIMDFRVQEINYGRK